MKISRIFSYFTKRVIFSSLKYYKNKSRSTEKYIGCLHRNDKSVVIHFNSIYI
jgi:hypothetical protein